MLHVPDPRVPPAACLDALWLTAISVADLEQTFFKSGSPAQAPGGAPAAGAASAAAPGAAGAGLPGSPLQHPPPPVGPPGGMPPPQMGPYPHHMMGGPVSWGAPDMGEWLGVGCR